MKIKRADGTTQTDSVNLLYLIELSLTHFIEPNTSPEHSNERPNTPNELHSSFQPTLWIQHPDSYALPKSQSKKKTVTNFYLLLTAALMNRLNINYFSASSSRFNKKDQLLILANLHNMLFSNLLPINLNLHYWNLSKFRREWFIAVIWFSTRATWSDRYKNS